MSEVMRWKLKGFIPGVEGVSKALFQPWVVPAEDFDQVTVERDALKTSLGAVTFNLDKTDKIALALQQRLTAADERVDVLDGLIGEVLDAVGREPLDLDAVLRLRARMRAALKPAEVGADSCEFCKGWGFRSNPDGADEGCGACNGTGKEPSDDQQ
ncbi:hypothetical protein QIT80_gp10 (endogenous virus) [Pseudomonas phage phiAH14a]|uniref:Uncharacterized protein n=1 Tax=Pseudomonas phage phiAH14a TaxID=1805958 RepID=A0A1B0VMC7_9CAUD|nr:MULTISPECIES: hypothetical protein [unclassified Pseudomonas]YP_010773027.1 hypothetical protein QIT80_gp10 [Pseudomonas phage phiAH14a]AMW64470.1 hypothetical protein AH14a_p10 [Pseudomonas phage phiAH14a]KAA0946698.1 hypothetical protein FQ182_13315 [Pseudomonas sp. ANT_H4]KAA0953201.1 hypothetical protein FQ186_06550 [Pseudomonas sp. ANT_H14]